MPKIVYSRVYAMVAKMTIWTLEDSMSYLLASPSFELVFMVSEYNSFYCLAPLLTSYSAFNPLNIHHPSHHR